MDGEYAKKTVKMAEQYSDFVMGFISQERVAGPQFVYMTPGVNL